MTGVKGWYWANQRIPIGIESGLTVEHCQESLPQCRRARENGLRQPGVLFCAIRAGDLARREHSLRTPAPSHAHDDTESGHKTMICSSVTGYMAAFWLVFSQVFGKHFRFEQTTVHPVGSLSEGRA
jgi:hypothetical protein